MCFSGNLSKIIHTWHRGNILRSHYTLMTFITIYHHFFTFINNSPLEHCNLCNGIKCLVMSCACSIGGLSPTLALCMYPMPWGFPQIVEYIKGKNITSCAAKLRTIDFFFLFYLGNLIWTTIVQIIIILLNEFSCLSLPLFHTIGL